MAVDIFDNDNGVVDHEADRDSERHQRNVVDAEVEKVHRCKGTQQRQWNRDAWDDRCPNVAQKQKNNHDDQANGECEGKLHLAH